jgi:rod shape determining protein RodA
MIPFFLVFRQPDLGSSIVYASFWSAMLLAGGLPVWFLVTGVGLVAILLPFLWGHLAQYQKSRITTFLEPELDPKGAGYNALQSMIAVGSGQLFGRGLGRGTQSHLRFLPEFHTDFIFATLVEELGFFGGSLLIACYGILLLRVILPILHGIVTDARVFIFSFGLFAMLLTQIFINAGMNMGLIPITGITLPFVSYGGSSILSTAVSFGILWAIARRPKS